MGDRGRRRFTERAHLEQKRLTIIGIIVGGIVGIGGVVATVMSSSAGSDPPTPVQTSTTTKPPLPVADQWLDLRKHLAQEGWAIRSNRTEQLRDDGRQSTILILRPKDPECAKTRSDQVRIVDVMRGRLQETFRFEPSVRGDCQTALNFKVLAIGRFEDDEDTRDLVATFSTTEDGPQGIAIPVVIKWDPVAERFTISGLLKSGPGLASFGFNTGPLRGTDKSWYDDAVKLYSKPFALSPTVSAWGASDVAFRRSGGIWAPLFVGLYRLNAGNAAPVGKTGGPDDITPVVFQRAIWSLYTNSQGRLLGGNCTIAKKNLLTHWDVGSDAPGQTTEEMLAWLSHRASDLAGSCDVDPNQP